MTNGSHASLATPSRFRLRQQAQTLSILVNAGIKTREEARAELGLAPEPGGGVREVQSVSRRAGKVHDGRGGWPAASGAPKHPTSRDDSDAVRPHGSNPADAGGGGGSGGGYEKCKLIPGDYGFFLYSCLNGAVRRLDQGRLGCRCGLSHIRDRVLARDSYENRTSQGDRR